MILNDREITQLSKEAEMIEPFAEGERRPGIISYGVTSFGYDMRVADEWTGYVGGTMYPLDPAHPENERWHTWNSPSITMTPGDFILCRSVEYFRVPDNVLGIVVGKSTYARCGLIVNCTPMEPGWHGELTIELHNASKHTLVVRANQGIAQVVFYRGARPAVTYADKKGKYQGQIGVTLGKVE